MLTPDYASPEQVTGGSLTTTSDVYSLGAVLYLLLTGKPAREFAGVPPDAILSVVVSRDAIRPSRWAPELKGDLETILLKALRKDRRERYQSVDQFADDLGRYLRNEPVTARAGSYAYRARKFVVRHRSGLVAAATATAALIASTAFAVRQARDSTRQRDVALGELRRAEATNEFSGFLLAAATPAAGKPISNAELLSRGETLIAKRFAAGAALRVHMLRRLADRYQENRQYSDRTRVLERAYAESRTLDDVGLRSDAACRWASQLAERGDFPQSFRLLDDVLRTLSGRPEYAAVEAGCRVTESINASQASDPVRATHAAERALALEERRGGIPAVRREALAALGTALKNATRYDDANRGYDR